MLHVRARGRKETLFLDKTVGACYDEVLKKVDTLDFDEALQAFSEFSMGDALVRLAYFQDKLHWDAVLRFDTTLHSPHHSHQRELREAFEFELLKEGLLVEKEASLDGKPDAFIKILCPFDKLAAEAQARRLHLPVKVVLCLPYQPITIKLTFLVDISLFRNSYGYFREWQDMDPFPRPLVAD